MRAFDSPFPTRTVDIGGVAISLQDVGTLGVVLGFVIALWAFFRFTKIGLALRASAFNAEASRLVGVRVGWMLALGWGLAAMLGAVAGMLAAPTVFLDPQMMQAILLYALAAAILGGIDSPIGAIVGGLLLGVGLNLIGTYAKLDLWFVHIDLTAAELRLPIASRHSRVLLVRPAGLLGVAGEEGLMGRPTSRTLGRRPSSQAAWPSTSCRLIAPSATQQFAYVGIYLIALIGLNICRLHRPDLARPRWLWRSAVTRPAS